MDVDDAVPLVVRAGEQRLELDLLDARLEGRNRAGQVGLDVLPLPRELQEGARVVEQGVESSGGLDVLFEARAALLELLGPLRVPPDRGVAQVFLERREGRALAIDIKGTSATLRPSRSARRSAGRAPAIPVCAPSSSKAAFEM
jgi:hypothetical protein